MWLSTQQNIVQYSPESIIFIMLQFAGNSQSGANGQVNESSNFLHQELNNFAVLTTTTKSESMAVGTTSKLTKLNNAIENADYRNTKCISH